MDYRFFVTLAQIAGLGLMGGSAVALLRLLLIHYVQRDWSPGHCRTLHLLTGLQSAGLLLLTFSCGSFLATRLFLTNDLPPVHALAVQSALLCVMAAGVIFLHVVVRPWLQEIDHNEMPARPLVQDVSAHRILAMTLAFAGFSAAWTLWLLQAATAQSVIQPAAMLASLALLTLVVWMILGVPAIVLRAMAAHAEREIEPLQAVPLRAPPQIPDVPMRSPAHVPAPRAPRPRLMASSRDFRG